MNPKSVQFYVSSTVPVQDAPKDLVVTLSHDQGGRGWLAFVDRNRIPQSFRRARICKFSRQKRRFLQLRENRPFVVVKRLTHTQARSLKHPF